MPPPGQISLQIGFLLALAHLGGFVAGVGLIARIGRSAQSDRALSVTAFGAALLMGTYVFAISEPTLVFWDFRNAYWPAARAVLDGAEHLLQEYEQGVFGFVNLPLIAYLFVPFALLPTIPASLVYFALSCVAVLVIWRVLCALYECNRTERAIVLFSLACFGPLHYSVRLGNVSHLVLAGLLVAMLIARKRRDLNAGFVFGACIIVKPVLGVIVLPMLACRRVRMLGVTAAVGVAAIGLSVAVFGWDLHRAWYERTIAPFATTPLAAFNSQSVASFTSRLEVGAAHYRDWFTTHPLSPWGTVFVWVTTAVVLSAIAWVLLARRSPQTSATASVTFETGLVLVVVGTCIVSTLAWAHYHVWLLPAIAHGLSQTRRRADVGRIRQALMAAFLLASPAVYMGPHAEADGVGAFLANVVLSNLLFASVVCFAALVWLHWTVTSPSSAVTLHGHHE